MIIVGAVAAYTVHSRYVGRAAKFDLTKIDNLAERSEILDANGELYTYFDGENRLVVPLTAISPQFQQAVLAREDSRFLEHHGVDSEGILRAVVTNLRAGGTKQGASTITQQLARNACGLGERSMDRKILEAVLARRIEEQYTKDQILEMYLNRIYFGAGYYGVEAASRGYFGKSASQLSLGESAALAALIRNPNRMAPSRNIDAAMEGRNEVLARMEQLHMITPDDRTAAQAQQLQVTARKSLRVNDDDVVDAVQRELGTLLAPQTIENGGLRVSMTIDPAMQKQAQAAADRRLSEVEAQKGYGHPKKAAFVPGVKGEEEKPTDYLQAAVVVIDNRTGAIRAAVGGRDYSQSKYSRALASKRQIGSTFKPFVYATAFERGLMPGTYVNDAKLNIGEFKDLPKKWSPENSDGEYGGLQPAAFGLLKSRNTMSVRVGEYASLAKVREFGQTVGLSDNIPDLPVVFLGAFETTARNLTAAYTIFPNGGVYRPPFLISKVEDHAGHILYEAPHAEKQVLSPESAWMVSGILQQVMKSGTAAKAAQLGWKKVGAGKTGTTNDFYDAWFVGYTASLTCGVWVGMDQPQTIMEKGYGAALALPIWVDVMNQAPENKYPASSLTDGVPFKKVSLCSVSGEKATSMCVAEHCAYQMDLPVSRIPNGTCRTHPEAAPMIAATMPTPAAPGSVAPAPAPVTAPTVMPAAAPATSIARSPDLVAPAPVATGPATTVRATPVAPVNSGYVNRAPVAPDRSVDFPEPQPASAAASQRPPAQTAVLPPSRPPVIVRSRSRNEAMEIPPTELPAVPDPAPPAPRMVEVRRAVPVSHPSSEAPRAAASAPPAQSSVQSTQPGVSERRIVEQLPDGRTRITTIRSTRPSAKGRGATPAPDVVQQ
ncbi:MAG TPA: PBP1A family penicillin-binding protein [Chthoniobacter sp.]|nr:PBP1A family penicillin-binding protein [Chthoniobacter sp.]